MKKIFLQKSPRTRRETKIRGSVRPRQLTLRIYVYIQIEGKNTDGYTHVWRPMPLTQTVGAVIYAVSDNDDDPTTSRSDP